MVKKADTFKEIVEKVWPKTRAEIEKGLKSTQKMLDKGKKYLEKEKLYYELGKLLSRTEKSQWTGSEKIGSLLTRIKSLGRQISKIK